MNTAQDTRPTWETAPYTQDQANAIKAAMQERGITAEQLLSVFPERPTSYVEAGKIFKWVVEQAKTVAPAQPSSPQVVADGYFAIPDGELGFSKPHFFRLHHGAKNGRWANTQFLKEQASDETYPVRGARKAEVLAYLAKHSDEARALYGELISRCSKCNRTLTDHDNPYFPMYGPECGGKV